MITGRFSYAASRLESARRMLVAPQREETDATADALRECHLGLSDLEAKDLSDGASQAVATIQEFMESRIVPDSAGKGTVAFRAEPLDGNQKVRLSNAVSQLAAWLTEQFEGLAVQ